MKEREKARNEFADTQPAIFELINTRFGLYEGADLGCPETITRSGHLFDWLSGKIIESASNIMQKN